LGVFRGGFGGIWGIGIGKLGLGFGIEGMEVNERLGGSFFCDFAGGVLDVEREKERGAVLVGR